MTGSDWQDPFAEDRDAQERERRRAEREARRRGTQDSLGEKVVEQSAEPPTGEEPAAPPADVPASEGRPPTGEVPRPHHPPPTADPGFEWTDSPRRGGADGGSSGGIPPQLMWFRRALGVVVVIALAAIVVFAFSKVIDALGGDDDPAGPARLEVGEVLIPEGLDRRQIADEVGNTVKGDYLDATKKAPNGFPIDKYAPDGEPPNLEGFLFPATYELEKGASAKDLVARQLAAFEDNIKGVDMSYAEDRNLNTYDVLKIASIIEREIAVPEERKLASAVVYNRLSAGDTLGMDATIRYGLQNYDEQLTQSELEDESNPYNTRVHPGLPPTPIGNPGLASIKAAANPAKTDAYYFVIKPGTCNEHTFVATEEEFLEAEAAYQQALEEQGGSPTDC